ncbi:MAG: Hpt domain-containing protein [Anaerolineae bacterium]|nr:MAG: Hpt domain-containing protein [Anaerolineae bacterium]
MTIDHSALDAYREMMGDEADAFIADIIDTYLNNAVNLFADLESALGNGDAQTFVRAAHTLKSTSATVGAQELSSLAAELEAEGKNQNLTSLAPKVAQAREMFAQVEEELRSMREALNV